MNYRKINYNYNLIRPSVFIRMFVRSFLLLSLCVAAIITGFFLIYRNLLTDNYRNAEYVSTYATMSQAATNLSQQLQTINIQAGDVLRNKETSSSLISVNNNSTARLVNISTALQNYTQKNLLVNRAWLYFELTETVLSEEDGYLPLSECDSFPLEALNHAEESMDTSRLTIFRYNHYYYMVTSYPEHTTLGILVTRIDNQQMYKAMADSLQSNADRTIYLYDNEMHHVFSSLTSAPASDSLTVGEELYTKKNLHIYQSASSKDAIACYTFPSMDCYLIQIIPEDIEPAAASIAWRFLPMILLSMLVILIFSIYMIRTTYQPLARIIHKLILSTDSDESISQDKDDAWRFIESRIQTSHQERQDMSSMLQSVAPALEHRILQQLLDGNIMDPQTLDTQLAQIDSPFATEGNYMVVALQAVGIPSASDEFHQNLFTLSLRSFLENYWNSHSDGIHIIETADVCLLGILRLSDDTTPAQLTLAFQDFRTSIVKSTEGLAFYPECGQSSMITSLLELHMASQQAIDQLRYNAYQRKASESRLANIIEQLPKPNGLLQPKSDTDQDRYIKDAKEFIAAHYSDSNLSQEMVCRHIGISIPYFSALFSEHENQNFLNYVHQFRIEKARQLLLETDDTISDIGFKTGFNSANSFIRVFKKLMQETPGKYRERARQTSDLK